MIKHNRSPATVLVVPRRVGDPRAAALAAALGEACEVGEAGHSWPQVPGGWSVVILPPVDMATVREVRKGGSLLAVDLAGERELGTRLATSLRWADYLLTETERERDLWIGAMITMRVVTPGLYDVDPGLRRLLRIVQNASTAEGLRETAAARDIRPMPRRSSRFGGERLPGETAVTRRRRPRRAPVSARHKSSTPRVLVISSDIVGPSMAGAGIRAFELASALASIGEVTLAAPGRSSAPGGLHLISFDPNTPNALRSEIDRADVVVTQPQWPPVTRWLERSGARLVFDLYAPEVLESLASWKERPAIVRKAVNALIIDRLAWALRAGDHFLCAGERQRDLWRGCMLGEGLATDADGQEPFSIVPFGLSEGPPLRTDRPGPRSQFPSIGPSDPLVLWNGGLWGWLDPLTVIRAMALVAERVPRARLVFMGKATHHQAQRATKEARDLATSLDLLDRTIFFNDVWVPYVDRANWLLDADCAVSAHHDHLETRFAFRTRLLDCFWSGLPVVCTEGDDLADRVARDGLGETVAPGDVDGMAAALERVLRRGRASFEPALARVAADYAWPVVTEPLVRYVTAPPPSRRLQVSPMPTRPGRFVRSIGFRGVRAALARTSGRSRPGGGG